MPPKKAKVDPEPVLTTRSSRSKKDDKVEVKNGKVAAKAKKDDSPSPPVKKEAKKATKKDTKKDTKKGESPAAKKDTAVVPATAPRTKRSKVQSSPSPSPPKKVKVDTKVAEPAEIKKVVVTGAAPVDEYIHNKDKYRVFEENNIVYDLSMNQTNIIAGNNNNKFYVVQVLQSVDNANNFYAFTRWGRVGVEGQQAMHGPTTKDGAIREFNKKKHEKSVKGDYRILERDFSATPVLDDKTVQNREDGMFKASKLHTKLKELVRMIFDMKMINNQMREIGYDAKKMPLGKLAASTIKKGYDVLNKISEELKSKAKTSSHVLETLTSEFYSQIPHDFGMTRAPILDTPVKVKAKLDMLDSIEQIQVATRILDNKDDSVNMFDHNYKKLDTNITYCEPTSAKYKLVKQYIENTHAATHANYSLEVLEVFELQKDLDDNRFKKEIGNRMLLWHGSRLTNYVGILSQGLRIAPPEAPATGYMFGKGVYFADMVSKSANYCATSRDNDIGLIMLGDVALGNTNEKFYADYNAATLPPGKSSTWGRGKTAPPVSSYIPMIDMPEVKVPIGKGEPTNIPQGSLLYNEFIVYDVAQIRLKYLIKMRWVYK